MAVKPWHELPTEVASVLHPVLAGVTEEIIAAVAGVPAYARPIEGPFGEGVKAGVQEAMRHFVAEIEAGARVQRSDVYVALGRGEMRAGRTLDALLSAYRIGARVAWRRFADAGAAAGLHPETMYLLAESIFAYIDELSAESAEGYALEQSAAAGQAEQRRRRLVRMLVREPPAEPNAIAAAADDAGWTLPRRLAALALTGERRETVAARLPPDTIADAIGELVCVLVPDPEAPGRGAEIERAILEAGAVAGLGTTVRWSEASLSFARARAALALAGPSGELVLARERAAELLLRSDERLARELAADRLAPLTGQPAGSQARLTETLQAWLEEQGRLTAVAERLGVHPQTVRYRLGRLRELFGGALDDADARFELELALRVTQR
jgi:hypothetical protein